MSYGQTPMEMLWAFHQAISDPEPPYPPAVLSPDAEELRFKLLREEFKELCAELGYDVVNVDAIRHYRPRSLRNLAKETADLIYVSYGIFDRIGVDGDIVVEAVHRSNMTKVGPNGRIETRDDGKVLKGPNYREPELRWLPE